MGIQCVDSRGYVYYKHNRDDRIGQIKDLSSDYVLYVFKPETIFRLKKHSASILIYYFWYLLTCGNYTIYYVRTKDGHVVHFSHVMPRIFKYAFMPNSGIHIGPCWTHPQHRGKGIYPLILNRILQDYRSDDVYIFIQSDNDSSKKGIEKCGFSPYAIGKKTCLLGRYVITSEYVQGDA